MSIPLAYIILATDAVAGVALIVLLSGDLPDPVAAKFGDGGSVTSYMSKSGYVTLMAGLAGLLPAAMALAFSWAPRHAPRFLNIPNKGFWIEHGVPPRLLAWMDITAIVLSSASVAFLVGLHWLIAQAHHQTPPRLDMTLFWPALAGYLGVILSGTVWMTFAFRRTPSTR